VYAPDERGPKAGGAGTIEAASGSSQGAAARPERFGHPEGLTFLFATEMWERFSYYGMRSLLVLYMVDYLLKPAQAGRVLGLDGLKHALEAVSGPLGAQPFASQIYGLYTGFVYLTPILGGILADRWLGRRRTVALGAALMVAGHFMMASEHLFLFALLLLVLGNGAFKPNIVTQVGGLYPPDDARRDRAYSIFYVGINIGAFFSPLVCGSLGEIAGWHAGFASAGIGMAIGLATYLVGLPRLPPDPKRMNRVKRPAGKDESFHRALLGVLLLFLPSVLFWAAYEQQGNTIVLWAEHFTDRQIDLGLWKGEIPVTWFQAFNPLMIFALTPPLVAWWSSRARRGREPATITKLSLGCFGLGLGFLILALAAWSHDGTPASWLWLVLYFIVITIAELHFSPIGLSLVAHMAPERSRSALMGVWMATTFAGNLLAGWLGSFWSALSGVHFFLLVAALGALAGGLIELARRPLRGLLPG
jgi:POT family proton-dependent oligopeptide transporter